MSSTPITNDLREYVDWLYEHEKLAGIDHGVLLDIADHIDAEHGRRMDDCRREVRRETIRYMRGVLTDLDRGVRRVRKGDKVEVVRCADCAYCQRHVDGSHVCELTHLAYRDDYYCYFGARREVDE